MNITRRTQPTILQSNFCFNVIFGTPMFNILSSSENNGGRKCTRFGYQISVNISGEEECKLRLGVTMWADLPHIGPSCVGLAPRKECGFISLICPA